ncbi:unnamed protein product [Tuber melanosporum]|uniref:(Perigord truffle) hypothetical protein n=1 Tax=Tuber melanosporum (strain Mel28) TaxID=656061 RepID=D5GKU2_TUBMM|nr:uncharacterized protein GSTUM_00009771001 [Tuber melanosporum]CAZ85135.1 unnamed protein product [Tuber melanosporum]
MPYPTSGAGLIARARSRVIISAGCCVRVVGHRGHSNNGQGGVGGGEMLRGQGVSVELRDEKVSWDGPRPSHDTIEMDGKFWGGFFSFFPPWEICTLRLFQGKPHTVTTWTFGLLGYRFSNLF